MSTSRHKQDTFLTLGHASNVRLGVSSTYHRAKSKRLQRQTVKATTCPPNLLLCQQKEYPDELYDQHHPKTLSEGRRPGQLRAKPLPETLPTSMGGRQMLKSKNAQHRGVVGIAPLLFVTDPRSLSQKPGASKETRARSHQIIHSRAEARPLDNPEAPVERGDAEPWVP